MDRIFLDLSFYNLYKYNPVTNKQDIYVEPEFARMHRDDPRHPQYAYIKAAHGTAGPGNGSQYPINDYIKPAIAALNAGWGVSPYHFYYMDMTARDQASAFFNSINAVYGGDLRLFGTGDPVIDLEDSSSQMYKSFAWDGVSDPSRQIANAKYFLGSVFKLALDTCDQLFSSKLGRPILTRIYSGAWFWNPIMKLLMLERPGGGYWPEHQVIFDYYKKRMAINAWYSADHQPFIPTEDQKMFMVNNVAVQYSSTAVPPLIGLNIPGRDGVLGSAVDQNLWLGDDVSYEKFIGVPLLPIGEVPPEPPSTDLEERVESLEATVEELEEQVAKLAAWKNAPL